MAKPEPKPESFNFFKELFFEIGGYFAFVVASGVVAAGVVAVLRWLLPALGLIPPVKAGESTADFVAKYAYDIIIVAVVLVGAGIFARDYLKKQAKKSRKRKLQAKKDAAGQK